MADAPAEPVEFPVQAAAGLLDSGTRVLKHGDTFLVCERHGDVLAGLDGQLGLYFHGTRHLSHLALRAFGRRLLLLESSVRDDNVLLGVELMNPDLPASGEVRLEHGTVHVRRERLLWEGSLQERIDVTSFAPRTVELELSIEFAADFADLFEVRGTRRARRGRLCAPTIDDGVVTLPYVGLDDVERRTTVAFTPTPDAFTTQRGLFRLKLQPRCPRTLYLAIGCQPHEESGRSRPSFELSLDRARARVESYSSEECSIETSNELFNEWIRRSQSDLRMMITETAEGHYPYAGVPWFSTPFGRDAIITALQGLWVNPSLAAGVLGFLAQRQAETVDDANDAEPGKILHEMRRGEMAALGEVPFARYYGSVDATPLFVVLAGRYQRATGDLRLVRRLWPAVMDALEWIDRYGDRDGDGFVEYGRRSKAGLEQQGWKDSHDSVFHADGEAVKGPVALAEVQAYVYAARVAAAELAMLLGDAELSRKQRLRAEELRQAFARAFWCEDMGTYALALDGKKRPCRVRASNAGHCLFTGIASDERAQVVADQLLGPELFSGWGVRTLASTEVRYNPMAYHNGSVWPHDNALIAEGLATYGLKSHALRIFEGLFGVSREMELHRLPELFCGFERRPGEPPTLYPVACAPQAWAAAAVFMLLSSVLGLRVEAFERRVALVQPVLPSWLETVRIGNLRVGDDRVDLTLRRYPEDVTVTVEGRTGPVEVIVCK